MKTTSVKDTATNAKPTNKSVTDKSAIREAIPSSGIAPNTDFVNANTDGEADKTAKFVAGNPVNAVSKKAGEAKTQAETPQPEQTVLNNTDENKEQVKQ